MNVLIADDSRITRHMLRSCLIRWGYECCEANNGLDALGIMLSDEDSPRLAIVDWHMPGLDGPAVCQRLREHSSDDRYCYVLMLTGNTDRESLLLALEAGVDDFLTKPFDEAELQQRLLAGRRIITLQDRLVAAHEALKIQATHDQLTGCWNRGAVHDFLVEELELAARRSQSLGVIMIDVDHFKQVNDMHGHQVGDDVLCLVVERLQMELRSNDKLGRYGGEEFLFVVPDVDLSVVTQIGERLRKRVCDTPFRIQDRELRISISLGATATHAQGEFDADRLICNADRALYSAKKSGRNRVHVRLDDKLPILEVTSELTRIEPVMELANDFPQPIVQFGV